MGVSRYLKLACQELKVSGRTVVNLAPGVVWGAVFVARRPCATGAVEKAFQVALLQFVLQLGSPVGLAGTGVIHGCFRWWGRRVGHFHRLQRHVAALRTQV